MSTKKKMSAQEQQEHFCFSYYENLQSILKDLEWIDKMIPREISRYAPASLRSNRDAIIQGRKHDLLSYIQTMCRDHLLYSRLLMSTGDKSAPWRPSGKRLKSGTIPHFREDQVGWKD